MKRQLTLCAALFLLLPPAALAQNAVASSRVLVHVDGALLGPPNISAEGGGGVSIDMSAPGKNAGLNETGGVSVGAEVRVVRMVWIEGSVGYYRPHLYTATFVDTETPIAERTDTVTLVPVTVGVNFRPWSWGGGPVSFAFGPQAIRFGVSGIPSEAGLAMQGTGWVFGLHGRLDIAFRRDWLASIDLQFTGAPDFTETATGDTRRLQSSGMFFKFGIGRRF